MRVPSQRKLSILGAVCCLLCFASTIFANTLFVDANGSNPQSPFVDWSTASTNIQDAIDASTDGDLILVTNGVYTTGGRSMDGLLTNRVALNKAVTVQSVNGPWVTTIQGAGPTIGTNAVRCAWLTNNASLIGFTLKWGATRSSSTGVGGGVCGSSSNLSLVANCVVLSNVAAGNGTGAYQVRLNNSLVTAGVGPSPAVYYCSLRNCTVVSNSSGGVYNSVATNCISYYNSVNSSASSLSYCCVTPSVAGTGNFTNAPQLFVDGAHLANGSPCIGAGTNISSGTDIFGNVWANPPAVGCAEWQATPMITIPQLTLTPDPVGFRITCAISSPSPFTCWWIKDGTPLLDDGRCSGTQTTNLIVNGLNLSDPGVYQLVATNASGVTTSAVATVVAHYVDVASTNAVSPFNSWASAATNIQDAITTANAGNIIFVTNGIYAQGGKSMDGIITNTVVLDKAIIVQSVNGPESTTIQGLRDPAGNGPLAVRCAWMTNSAVLSGFTLTGGATRGTGFAASAISGGGVWSSSTSATLFNCSFISNSAYSYGGGAYQAKLISCLVTSNTAGTGGGASSSILRQCRVIGNVAAQNGSGTDSSTLTNCAIISNSCSSALASAINNGRLVNCTVRFNVGYATASNFGAGAAVQSATLINCIVDANTNRYHNTLSNHYGCSFSYSDTVPLPVGTGNISTDPMLLPDSIHLLNGSPCIGAGTNNVVLGNDVDGRPFANPPSMGCSEWVQQPIVFPQLSVRAIAPGRIAVNAAISGQPPLTCYWTHNGTLIHDNDSFKNTTAPNLVVTAANCAGSYQVMVSNSFGVATSAVVQIVAKYVDPNSAAPTPPYTSWPTAAASIQDAIDIANPGDFIVVTNGLYASGERSADGVITNRIVVDKPVTVMSLNGYSETTIQGAWDPTAPITAYSGGVGPLAIRCAWLTNNATLMGFAVQGGAANSGGGVFCCSSSSLVANCFVVSNRASSSGGGVANGTIDNSYFENNLAYFSGGGAYFAILNNCTIFNNFLTFSSGGAGIYNCAAYNCIISDNYDSLGYVYNWNSGPSSQLTYCCTTPLPSGAGNINSITARPVFTDVTHISSSCACRGAGSAGYSFGVDIDGEPWSNPPSMGCDEIIDANLVGPLGATITAPFGTNGVVTKSLGFDGAVNGRVSQISWFFDDGTTITNANWFVFHAWTNSGTHTVALTAYNADYVMGVITNMTVFIAPIYQPVVQTTLTADNTLQFAFPTQESVSYRLLAATNLTPPVTWTTLSAQFGTGITAQFTDKSATNFPVRFYQIQAQ